jgi:hypothetical protein
MIVSLVIVTLLDVSKVFCRVLDEDDFFAPWILILNSSSNGG